MIMLYILLGNLDDVHCDVQVEAVRVALDLGFGKATRQKAAYLPYFEMIQYDKGLDVASLRDDYIACLAEKAGKLLGIGQ
jgi:hypothetical protein